MNDDKWFYLLQSLPIDHDFFLPKRTSEATKECIWQENINNNVEVGLFFPVCVIIAIIKYFLYYSLWLHMLLLAMANLNVLMVQMNGDVNFLPGC